MNEHLPMFGKFACPTLTKSIVCQLQCITRFSRERWRSRGVADVRTRSRTRISPEAECRAVTRSSEVCQPVRGWMNALRVTWSMSARSESAPYQADVRDARPYQAAVADIPRSKTVCEADVLAGVRPPYQMAQTGGNVRPCYIFHMNLCNATAPNNIHYCNRNTLFDRMRGRNRFGLPHLLSISDNKDAPNALNHVKYITTLNKNTVDIAFERILCYNHAAKEKNHAA